MIKNLTSHESRVLIVEDDEQFSAVVEQFIKRLNPCVEIYSVKSEKEAIQQLNSARFDLVILDYTLTSSMTGLYVWEYCRKRYPEVPAIMVSGMPVEEFLSVMNGHQSFPRFLSKPFRRKEFQKVLHD